MVSVEEERGGDSSLRKLERTSPRQDPNEYSQVRRQESTQLKQVDGGIFELSTSTMRLARQSLFNINTELMLEHSEDILNVNTIESTSPSWTRSPFSHVQAIKWTKAKVRVYLDSVLCLVKMSFHKEAITR